MAKNQLAIKTKVVPPPSRNELIEAMAQIKRLENLAINESIRNERNEIEGKIMAALWAVMVKEGSAVLASRGGYDCFQIKVDCSRLVTPSIKKMQDSLSGLRLTLQTDIKELRKQIRSKMDGATESSERVSKLVKENAPELTAMLSALFSPSKQIAS